MLLAQRILDHNNAHPCTVGHFQALVRHRRRAANCEARHAKNLAPPRSAEGIDGNQPAPAILSSAIQSAAAAVLIPNSSANAITCSVWSKIWVTLE